MKTETAKNALETLRQLDQTLEFMNWESGDGDDIGEQLRSLVSELEQEIVNPVDPVAELRCWMSGPELGAPERVIYVVKLLDKGLDLPMGLFDLYVKPQEVAA